MRTHLATAAIAAIALSYGLIAAGGQNSTAGPAIPRTADGRPNLSGVWQVINTAAWDIQGHNAQKGVPGGIGVVEGDEIPYQPWAAEKKKQNYESRMTADPEGKCYLPGVPRIMYMPFPFQIVQTGDRVVMLFEYVHAIRYLHMNGNEHPEGHIDWWLGDSRARWEGDTLVVDVVHFNEDTWFDRAGNFHSDALHLVERFTPTGPDHIDYEVTVEDPKVFTRPWKMRMPLYRRKESNMQLLEYECYAFDWEKYYPYPGLW
jgi:hypothetical protein